MPALISEPLILQPPTDLPARFPHAVNLARQLALKYVHHYVVTEADLQTVGGVLWQTLDAEAALESARRAAGTRILPLIVASADPLAQSLPWECLYHPRHGFLGQQPGFTLSRRLTADESPPAALSTGPLKVLLFTPMPDDLDPEKERLDVESEQAAVLEALDPLIQDGLVELTTPDDGRFAHLQALLREEAFHLVFLSGHGEFREISFQPPAAVFIFEGESRRGKSSGLLLDCLNYCYLESAPTHAAARSIRSSA